MKGHFILAQGFNVVLFLNTDRDILQHRSDLIINSDITNY